MTDLRAAHDQLLELLDALEALTAGSYDEATLAPLRYRLTRASSARRRMVEAIAADLITRLPATETAPIHALRQANTAAMARSADHIGSWSLRDIAKDWQGYCHASAQMRRAMREQIELEKRTLYPLLDR